MHFVSKTEQFPARIIYNYMYIGIITVVTFAIPFVACDKIGKRSPSETVKAFYSLANEKKYSKAKEYLSSEVLNALDNPMMIISISTKELMNEATRNGTIEKVEILREEIQGEEATVHVRLHLKGGRTVEDRPPLIKEDGVWKITFE